MEVIERKTTPRGGFAEIVFKGAGVYLVRTGYMDPWAGVWRTSCEEKKTKRAAYVLLREILHYELAEIIAHEYC